MMEIDKRVISLEGALNFRDAGGYETSDGRKVRWGKIFRSGELSGITNQDIIRIQNLGIKHILDYRTQYEYDHCPDKEIPGVTHRLLPAMNVDPAREIAFSHEKLIAMKDLRTLQGENNPLFKHYKARGFYSNNKAYKVLMELLKSDDDSGFIQHCFAGKDRTGLGVAMVLKTLGVERETIVADYMLTNEIRRPQTELAIEEIRPYLANEESVEVYRAIIEVRQHYIETLLDSMDNLYGDFDAYLKIEYGISGYIKDKIKEKYLQK